MLKFLCLISLICSICCAPVDVKPTTGDGVVENVVLQKAAPLHVQNVDQKKHKVVEILESGSEHQTDGSYTFHYRGADGSFREETAVVKNRGTDHEHLSVTGAYSFFDSDGKEVIVHYTADDKGFVPVGNNISDAISLAAKTNSQLPSIKKVDVDDDEDSEEIVLKKKSNN